MRRTRVLFLVSSTSHFAPELKLAALLDVSERLLKMNENLEMLWQQGSWLDWMLMFFNLPDLTGDQVSSSFHAHFS